MEVSEACTKIAEIIQSDEVKYPETGGLLIQFFNEELAKGETPKMALVLAKRAIAH